MNEKVIETLEQRLHVTRDRITALRAEVDEWIARKDEIVFAIELLREVD